jgi:HAD superfamily phosphoserine phosphatase-like hydrolase
MKILNVYDFDNTIYDGDSTIDFYIYCLKRNKMLAIYFPMQITFFLAYKTRIISKEKFKEGFFSYLKGINNIDDYVQKFYIKNNYKIKQWFINNIKNQKNIVIVSASPSFIISPFVQKFNINVIATIINKNNGKFLTKNCYGVEKLNRLKLEYNNFKINCFYSDSNSDLPLAMFSQNAYLVKKNKVIKWKI